MKITLLGMEFAIGNKGCEALSYSFVSEMDRISKELGVPFEYTTVVFAVDNNIKVPATNIPAGSASTSARIAAVGIVSPRR